VEDQLTDFEFNQAYTNWLMLIEMVSDLAMEQGWHVHHKCMVSDRVFVEWDQAGHVHDHLLCSQFMQHPSFLTSPIPPTRSSSSDVSLTKLYNVCCMYVFVHKSAGRTVHIGLIEVSPQKPVFIFEWFSLLTKGRNTNREHMHVDADKAAIGQSGQCA